MKYSVSTMFDRETWQVYGENWLRQARSLSLDGYVVDAGLDDDAVAKVKGMGFMCLPAQTGSPDRSNIFEPFVKAMSPGETCLWVQPYVKPISGLSTGADLMCETSHINVDSLASIVINLYDRAAMTHSLEEKIRAVHGAYLSTRYILGSHDFWVGFLGCQNYLSKRQYLVQAWPAEDLVLNFFVAFANSFSVEVKPYPEATADSVDGE